MKKMYTDQQLKNTDYDIGIIFITNEAECLIHFKYINTVGTYCRYSSWIGEELYNWMNKNFGTYFNLEDFIDVCNQCNWKIIAVLKKEQTPVIQERWIEYNPYADYYGVSDVMRGDNSKEKRDALIKMMYLLQIEQKYTPETPPVEGPKQKGMLFPKKYYDIEWKYGKPIAKKKK